MITHKTKWLLVGLVCLALWPAHASAQGGPWETYRAAGDKAYQRGNYPEAEKQWGAAVREAEGFGPQDPLLATSLNNLAVLYRAQGKYAEAEAQSPSSRLPEAPRKGPRPSPTASMQLMPLGLVRMMVQVPLLGDLSTSTSP